MRVVAQIQANPKRAARQNDVSKFVQIRGQTISCQTHYFVFVSELPETEILRHSGVEHAQRMRKGNGSADVYARAFADTPHGAGKIAQAVGRKHGGAIKR